MENFVHLHVHSEYSLLDGACRIKELVSCAKQLNQPAVAITDHGTMYGVIDFYKECKKEGIKPIIGCEVYVANRSRFDKVHKLDKYYHLILLCQNETGYKNLIKLVSAGFIDGFYTKPRIDRELLIKHHEGLICLSACLAGEIPRLLSAGEYEKAKETAIFYKNLFGKNNYYLEIQNHNMPEQMQILPQLVRLSKELDIELVATNDAHYLKKEDAKAQAILMCIQTNTVYGAENAMQFPSNEFYLKSYDEMNILFKTYENALSNTLKIADMCNLEFEFGVTKLPRFDIPGVSDNTQYFTKLCNDGLKKRYGDELTQVHQQRLNYELDIIIKMGFVNYFLIVWDFIRYAKENNIPVGPGRGSGAGSIAAYSIGITGIDPIKYNLLFERFLNPERVTMPDFDIDFCYEKRQLVIDYVVKKYHSDHVAQIITFGTMAAKQAIRDVGRALGVQYQVVDSIAKMIPFELHMTIEKALEMNPDLKAIYTSDEKCYELIEMAKKLEGMPRHASTHAAGVVITREQVSEYVPLQKNDDAIVTQFTMTTLEELGLLKMDFLGLRNLTVIKNCEDEIKKSNPNFSINDIDTTDKEVFEMLSSGDSKGVFQFESAGMTRVLTQLRPNSIEDLIAVISLYRPGPMDSIPKYIKNRHNPNLVVYKHPLLSSILDVTYGCIVYQEQVMQICRELAGYSYGRADLVRRAMSKKKIDVMEKERHNFIFGKVSEDGTTECVGAVFNGVSEKIANEIFDEMSSFAAYAFNKSHAAAYALISYQTAYLKCHYNKQYFAALLTSILANTDKVIEYIDECANEGIKVLPPNINTSDIGFTCNDDKSINFGLLAVKNLGKGVIIKIINERENNGKFTSLFDFCERLAQTELNKKAIESLIKCGAFDTFDNNRMEMMRSYEKIIDTIDYDIRKNVIGQIDFFSAQSINKKEFVIPKCENYSHKELLNMEKEVTGLYVSGHPLDEFNSLSSDPKYVKIATLLNDFDEKQLKDARVVNVLGIVVSRKILNTKSGNNMAFIKLEDKSASIEVIAFPNVFAQNSAILQTDSVISINGKISLKDDESPKIIIETVVDARKLNVRINKTMYIKLKSRKTEDIDVIVGILKKNSGTDKVMIYIEDEKKYISREDIKVNCNETLLSELKLFVGDTNVVIKSDK